MRKLKRFFFLLVVLAAGGAFAYFYFYKDVPSYKEARNLKLLAFTKDKIAASVDVICHNPNRLGLTLTSCDIDVTANGKEACNVKQNYSTPVPAESDFTVPLTISFSPLKVFKPADLLTTGIRALESKSIDLNYKGIVLLGLAGKEIEVEVDFDEKLSLKKAS